MIQYLHLRISAVNFIRAICAGAAAVVTYVFGGADKWLIGLVIVVIADYISGIIAAAIAHELNSKKGFAGVLKKVLLFCVVAVAEVIDKATNAGGVLRSSVVAILIANESLSVLENTSRCGVKYPKKLLMVLEQLRGEDEKNPPQN